LKLSGARKDIRDIFQKLSDRRSFDVLTDLDRLVAKLDRVTEKVNHASYGYSGFFDVVKIREEALDRMINFDDALLDDVAKFVDEVTAFKGDIMKQNFDSAKEHVQSLTEALDDFEQSFDSREEEILGVK
jgi:hypothetical protein